MFLSHYIAYLGTVVTHTKMRVIFFFGSLQHQSTERKRSHEHDNHIQK